MAESPKFDPADYLDGGKKKFNGNDYASLAGLNGEKIKQIALARIAARKEEAVTIARDQEGALKIVAMFNPFDNTTSTANAAPVAAPVQLGGTESASSETLDMNTTST